MPPIPSVSWVEFQFMPRHPTRGTASRHTGRLKMRRTVQSRTLRDLYPDDHWCNALNVNVNEFMVELNHSLENEHYRLILAAGGDTANVAWPALSPAQSVAGNDKSKVAVGEPGHAVPTNVRPAAASLANVDVELLATDHSFHRASLIPSVNLL